MSEKDQFTLRDNFTVIPSQPRISRDEMNLAEFPLTILSTRSNPKTKTLEFSDSIKNKSGELINRKWIITAADKFGLPTASDDEVLLGLLKLTVDDGVKNPKVYFTRYEMLKTLRWTTEGRSYSRLQKALDRLSGVRIKASNAFYDNETKTHSTKNFGILDAYEINDGRDNDNKKSFFIWSEVIFKSFQVGFIKKLDLDFYLQLTSAVSKRIYRFLDKHFWYKSRIQINLITFAHEKIGISRNYRFVSSIRQQLDPAIEELIESGFISACEYTGKGSNAEIILYSGKSMPRVLEKKNMEKNNIPELRPVFGANQNIPISDTKTKDSVIAQSDKKVGAEKEEEDLYAQLLNALSGRGINPKQVEKILAGKDQAALRRIGKIISHFDLLQSNSSPHISKNPAGFLYRAVENPYQFNLPGEAIYKQGYKQQVLNTNTEKIPSAAGKINSAREDFESLQSKYLIERKQKIIELRKTVESSLLSKINVEVGGALSKLKGMISEPRFNEAVEHGVDERLAKLFAVPDFEEWIKGRRVIH
jgi:plasmid replication initiation protein